MYLASRHKLYYRNICERNRWPLHSSRAWVNAKLKAIHFYSGKLFATELTGHTAGVVSLHGVTHAHSCFSWATGETKIVNQNTLISGGSAPTFEYRVWDLETRKCLRTFPASASITSFTSTQITDDYIVFADAKVPRLCLQQVAAPHTLSITPVIHDSTVLCLSFDPQYMRMVSGSHDCTLKYVEMTPSSQSGRLLLSMSGMDSSVWSCDMYHESKDVVHFVAGLDSGKIIYRKYRLKINFPSWLSPAPTDDKSSSSSSVSINQPIHDPQLVAWFTGNLKPEDGEWVLEDSKTLIGHSTCVMKVKFDRHEPSKLFSSSYDTSLIQWDLQSGQVLRTFVGHTNVVFSFDVTTHLLFSASRDGTLRIWDKDTGDQINKITVSVRQDVKEVVVLPDMSIATGGYDGIIRIWKPLPTSQIIEQAAAGALVLRPREEECKLM